MKIRAREFNRPHLWVAFAVISTVAIACGDDSGTSDPDDVGGASGEPGSSGHAGRSGGSGGISGGRGGAPPAIGGHGGGDLAGAGGTTAGTSAGGGAGGALGGVGAQSGGIGGELGGAGAYGGGAGEAGSSVIARQCTSVTFTNDEKTRIATLGPLAAAVPASPTNAKADDAAAATLGQKLFFDKSYSGPLALKSDLGEVGEKGKISCASCHSSDYLADDRDFPPSPAVSIGANTLTRNAPTLINSSFYMWTNWGGRFGAQWQLPPAVAENPRNMNSTRLDVVHLIGHTYKAEYEAVFGAIDVDVSALPTSGKPKANPTDPDGPWEGLTDAQRTGVNEIMANYGKAIEAYLRKLVSRNSPFDAFVGGDEDALSVEEKCGLRVFVGKGKCTLCHSGPKLSDDQFHNIGVAQGATVDNGRFADGPPLVAASNPWKLSGAFSDDTTFGAQRESSIVNPMPDSTKAAFRTPSLRGVDRTAPYMHDGQLATLEAVVEFYVRGGDTPPAGTERDPLMTPLALTDEEKADLVAFLKTLTGEEIPPALLDDPHD